MLATLLLFILLLITVILATRQRRRGGEPGSERGAEGNSGLGAPGRAREHPQHESSCPGYDYTEKKSGQTKG